MTFEQQVHAVRRRFVQPQVRKLRMSARWSALDADLVADCVLAAGGDIVVTDRLYSKWILTVDAARTMDLTHEEEQALVAYIRTMQPVFDCDCGTCGPVPHGSRFMHGAKP